MEIFLLACAAIGLVAIGIKIHVSRVTKRLEALTQAASDAAHAASDDAEELARAALTHAQRHWGRGSPACAQPLQALATYFENTGKQRKAIRFYERVIDAVRDAPEYAELREHAEDRMAWCHLHRQNLAAARGRLDRIEASATKEPAGEFFPRTALCRAAIARLEGSPERAEALLKAWLKASAAWSEKDAYRNPPGAGANPKHEGASSERVFAFRELAEALDAQGRTVEAQRWRLAAVVSMEHDPAKDDAVYEYETHRVAIVAESDQDWEAALQHYSVLVKSKDRDTRAAALVGRGHCELQLDRPAHALRSYEQVLERDTLPESEELARWVRLRVAELEARRNPERAVRVFAESGVARGETEPFDTSEIATAEWLSGRRKRAQKWIDRQAEASGDAEALAELAEWNASRGRLELADRNIDRAIAIFDDGRGHPGRVAQLITSVRTTLARYRARFDEAERLLSEVKLPDDPVSHAWSSVERGILAESLGRSPLAARHYQDALDKALEVRVAREWRAHVNVMLVRTLLSSGETDAALERAGNLSALLDDHIPAFSGTRYDALTLEVELAVLRGDNAEAATLLVRGIELAHSLYGFAPELHLRQANFLFGLERHEEAGEAASRALAEAKGVYAESHPLVADADAVHGRIAAAAGDTVLARELLGRAVAALERHSHASAATLREELASLRPE